VLPPVREASGDRCLARAASRGLMLRERFASRGRPREVHALAKEPSWGLSLREAQGLMGRCFPRCYTWTVRRGPVEDGPWYPGFHWTDSSPRAPFPHASVIWKQRDRGPNNCWALTAARGASASELRLISVVNTKRRGAASRWIWQVPRRSWNRSFRL
jgi:hypothetical protein